MTTAKIKVGPRINPFDGEAVIIKGHVHLRRWSENARKGGRALYYLGHLATDCARNEKDGDHTVQYAKKIAAVARELHAEGSVVLVQCFVPPQGDQMSGDYAYIAVKTEKAA